MKKMICLTLVLLLASAPALAGDLSAMTSEELAQLRLDIDRELAARAGTDGAQVISVDGILFRFLLAETGEARDGRPGLGIILLADNPTDRSLSVVSDLAITVSRGGRVLETSWVKSEHFTSSTVSVSQQALIHPGDTGRQVCLGYVLDGEGDRIEITLALPYRRIGQETFCGRFSVPLP